MYDRHLWVVEGKVVMLNEVKWLNQYLEFSTHWKKWCCPLQRRQVSLAPWLRSSPQVYESLQAHQHIPQEIQLQH